MWRGLEELRDAAGQREYLYPLATLLLAADLELSSTHSPYRVLWWRDAETRVYIFAGLCSDISRNTDPSQLSLCINQTTLSPLETCST